MFFPVAAFTQYNASVDARNAQIDARNERISAANREIAAQNRAIRAANASLPSDQQVAEIPSKRREAHVKPFVNPRNAASGTMRQEDTGSVALRSLDFWRTVWVRWTVPTTFCVLLFLAKRASIPCLLSGVCPSRT